MPHTIITDFEAAAIAAFRAIFPSALIRNCLSSLRHVQTEGSTRKYLKDPKIYVGVRMLVAVAASKQSQSIFTTLFGTDATEQIDVELVASPAAWMSTGQASVFSR